MLAQYQRHRGALGCYPTLGSAAGKSAISSSLDFTEFPSMLRYRFQATRKASCGSPCLRRLRTGKNHYTGHEEVVCQGGIPPYLPEILNNESNSVCSEFFSKSQLLPMAAVALAFFRASSVMVYLSEEFQRYGIDVGDGEVRNAAIVKDLTEACRWSLPWRPGFEKALMQQGGISLALLSATAIAQDHLNPIVATLRANPTFMSGLIAWAIAQVAKAFTYYMVVRKWDLRMVMGSGGMPSSHSALCFALTTSVAFVHGVSDALFPVCLGFTLIVMYDAAGVRRHAGRQAEVLNMIVADLFQGHPISERKLKELLGHTPLQVFAGAALGTVVGYLCSRSRLA